MTSSASRASTRTTARVRAATAARGGFDFGDLGDIFGSFFGGGFGGGGRRNPNAPQRGESIRASLSVELYGGGLRLREGASRSTASSSARPVRASGCAPGTTPEVCPQCHGTGTVTQAQRTPFGMMQSQHRLPQVRRQGPDHPPALPRLPGRGRRAQAPAPFRSTSPPVSTTARPSPCGDRATPAKTAAPRAIC